MCQQQDKPKHISAGQQTHAIQVTALTGRQVPERGAVDVALSSPTSARKFHISSVLLTINIKQRLPLARYIRRLPKVQTGYNIITQLILISINNLHDR